MYSKREMNYARGQKCNFMYFYFRVSEIGLTETLKKVNRVDVEKEGTEEEKDTLISKRESSHDLD